MTRALIPNDGGLPSPAEDRRTLILRTLKEELMQSKNPNTRAAYDEDLRRFFRVKSVEEIDADMVLRVDRSYALAYKAELQERRLSHSTIQRRFAFICSYYDLLARLRLIPFNPLEKKLLKLPNAQATRVRTTSMSDDEAVKILAVPDRREWRGARDFCLLVFALAFGLRRQELVRLNVEDVESHNGRLDFSVLTKGGKMRPLVFDSEVEAVYAAWLSKRGTFAGPIFTAAKCAGGTRALTSRQVWNVIHTSALSAGVQRRQKDANGRTRWYVHPHSFRATHITRLLKSFSIGEVQADMIHSNPATTLGYSENQRINHEAITGSFSGLVKKARKAK